jgi:hypothetical protein
MIYFLALFNFKFREFSTPLTTKEHIVFVTYVGYIAL